MSEVDALADLLSEISTSRRKQYKNTSLDSQRTRREQFLLKQQNSRSNHFARIRQLAGLETVQNDCSKNSNNSNQETSEDMVIDGTTSSNRKLSRKKRKELKLIKLYKRQLMLAENLQEVPEDLSENWCCVPIPIGRRCLVVASHSKTQSRSVNGKLIRQFSSFLPGGGVRRHTDKQYCILDCIYDEPTFTYFILDILCWNGNQYYDCNTDFRFFWLSSKLGELDENISEMSEWNPFKFVMLQRFACDQDNLNQVANLDQERLDGYMFYHKESHYNPGYTPLVCRLKKDDMLVSTVFGD
eukprot:TRINITY_DN9814_c0_g1_i1.p1 TRINITY_DN9814_c0_g1~~TRINITY_DN9814_c0_g1_i1.p1  ORF type:complete len:309 (+),score=38.00 TRINITY_DN9814_c0_g1_i1:32-928(+)